MATIKTYAAPQNVNKEIWAELSEKAEQIDERDLGSFIKGLDKAVAENREEARKLPESAARRRIIENADTVAAWADRHAYPRVYNGHITLYCMAFIIPNNLICRSSYVDERMKEKMDNIAAEWIQSNPDILSEESAECMRFVQLGFVEPRISESFVDHGFEIYDEAGMEIRAFFKRRLSDLVPVALFSNRHEGEEVEFNTQICFFPGADEIVVDCTVKATLSQLKTGYRDYGTFEETLASLSI